MKTLLRFIMLGCCALQPALLHARPVDLSAPGGTFGPATDQGHALHWVEFAEIDFGGGLSLPLRMSFLSGRDGDSADFGAEGWRSPMFTSRLKGKTKDSWPVLLPCGKLMTMVPQPGNPNQWGTPDGEWLARFRGGSTLVAREDGWEMEFDRRGLLVRLKTDSGRNVLWNRDAQGALMGLSELINGRPSEPLLTVQRDTATGLVSAMEGRTAFGTKTWKLAFDAGRRLQSIAFPDRTSVVSSYDTTAEGHPRITITGRDLIQSVLAWHKDTLTLVSDGVWSYDITPQSGTGPIMNRTGPHGETESYQDDEKAGRLVFTAANGVATIQHKVRSAGPARGKIERIERVGQPAGLPGKNAATGPGAPMVIYSATYDARGMLAEETDALGRKTTHAYVLHGASPHSGIQRHTITDPLGNSVTEEFDRHGNLVAMTDSLGHTTRHEYDGQNRRTRTLGPDGAVTEVLTYTAAGQIASRTDALGATTRYTYDRHGNRVSTTDALGHETKDTFDERGNRISTTDALGRTWRFAYSPGGRLLREFDPEGNEIASHSYDAQGRRTATTDAAGKTRTTEYDALGRVIARTDALERTTKYAYNVKLGASGCIACSASGLPTLITLPSGRQIKRVYDADKHLLEEAMGQPARLPDGSNTATGPVAPPSPSATRHTYDLVGNLLSTTDPLGRATAHIYDAGNRRIKTIHPDKTEKTFAYDAAGRLVTDTDELGHTTKREYDAYGNLVAITNAEGHVSRTLFEGGAIVPIPSKEGQAGGVPRPAPHFAAARRPTGILTAAGVRSAFLYDALGRKAADLKGSAAAVTAALQAIAKDPASIYKPNSALRAPDSALALTSREFDAVGNELRSINPMGRSLSHEYDARNRRVATTDVLGRRWSFSYAATAGASGPAPCCGAPPETNAKAGETIFPDGTKEITVTDAAGQVIEKIDAKGDSTKFSYDSDGRLATLTDGRGSVTRWQYDAHGKLAAKIYPDKTMEIYEHDAAGQMVRRVRPSGVAAAYAYDLRGRLLSIQWDDGKTEPSTFAYDAAGRMVKAVNPSALVSRGYTATGRLKSESQKITASFDPPPVNPGAPVEAEAVVYEVQYAHDPDGRLARLVYPDKTALNYTYNARGELAEVTSPAHVNFGRPDDKTGLIARYTRHPDGSVARLEMGNGLVTTKDYDLAGRLIKTTHAKVGPPSRLPSNDKATGTVTPPLEVLDSETLRYDDRDRRTARIRADGQADLFSYDPAGQVIAAAYGEASSTAVPAVSPATGPVAKEGGATGSVAQTPSPAFTPEQTFEYDAAGNRMKTTENGQTTAYQANASNQYTQLEMSGEVFHPEYDKNGNLLKDPSRTYTWDADIHLLSVTTKLGGSPKAAERAPNQESGIKNQESEITESFRYDALHRRVARQVSRPVAGTPGTTREHTFFILDGWNVITEYAQSGATGPVAKGGASGPVAAVPSATDGQASGLPHLSARHLWGEDLSRSLQGAGGIGGLLTSTHFHQRSPTTANNRQPPRTNPQTHFLSYDSNGNVMLLTDTTCVPSASYRYDSFGRVTKAAGSAAALNRYQFSTKPVEVGSGFAYYGYRYYSPELGRWLSRDPIGEKGGFNVYEFAENGPAHKADTLGLGTNWDIIQCYIALTTIDLAIIGGWVSCAACVVPGDAAVVGDIAECLACAGIVASLPALIADAHSKCTCIGKKSELEELQEKVKELQDELERIKDMVSF